MDPVQPRTRARFDGVARQAPEARGWLALVDEVLREAATGAWTKARVAAADGSVPWLARARVTVPAGVARRWVRRLLAAAGEHGGPGLAAFRRSAEAVDPAALLDAAVRFDADAVERLAHGAGADAHAFAQVAHLAAVPLLLALLARVGRPSALWRDGPCPTCGAFAALAESRGLAREHRLRCGRCGTDGAGAELTCGLCGNADPERLRFLVPEGNPQARRVLACRACEGYLRVVPTLEPIAPEALLLEDVAHVDLDLVAAEHGYRRPAPALLVALELVLGSEDEG